MIKKRYFAVAGLIVLAVAATGCGKKSEPPTTVEVTPTPIPEATPTVTAELVDMETTEEKNVMGEKTSTASRLTIVNQTGSEIKSIYIRVHPSDDEEDSDEWGEDLVAGMFTIKNGENAVYYYEKPSTASNYDIRITYTDEEKSECFFRDLPLTTIQKITLRMNGKDDSAIPYATYVTSSGGSEVSTLDDVKKRLGMDSGDESDSENTPDPTSTPDSEDTPDPTSTPSPDDDNNGDDNNNNGDNNNDGDNNNTQPSDSTIQTAEQYIGQSVDDLIGSIGEAQSSEWEEDETTGTSGYYYYPNFTVSTTVDENGNEIVTGVW